MILTTAHAAESCLMTSAGSNDARDCLAFGAEA